MWLSIAKKSGPCENFIQENALVHLMKIMVCNMFGEVAMELHWKGRCDGAIE
jgi:hypothetical protein